MKRNPYADLKNGRTGPQSDWSPAKPKRVRTPKPQRPGDLTMAEYQDWLARRDAKRAAARVIDRAGRARRAK